MKIPKRLRKEGLKSQELLRLITKKARQEEKGKRPKLVRLPKEEIYDDTVCLREPHEKEEYPEFWENTKTIHPPIPAVMGSHPKYGKQFLKGHSYAFYLDSGEKLIGFFFKKRELFKDTVHLWVKNPQTGELTKYIVPRSRVNFDPWASVPDVPREAPPKDVLYRPEPLERYRRQGQSKAKGLIITPAIKRQQERDHNSI